MRETPPSLGLQGYNGTTWGTLQAVDDSKKMQRVDARGLNGETFSSIERPQIYGFTSVPLPPDPSGPGAAEVEIGFRAGNRSHPYIRSTDDRRYRMKNLQGGIPLPSDIAAVQSYLDLVRPVAVKDRFIVAPIPTPVNFALTNLVGDSTALRAAVANGVSAMLARRAAPAYALNGIRQPATNIPAAWVDAAVYAAVGGVSYDLVMQDAIMPNAGCLAVLGTIG